MAFLLVVGLFAPMVRAEGCCEPGAPREACCSQVAGAGDSCCQPDGGDPCCPGDSQAPSPESDQGDEPVTDHDGCECPVCGCCAISIAPMRQSDAPVMQAPTCAPLFQPDGCWMARDASFDLLRPPRA